jgi:hypothetical protein
MKKRISYSELSSLDCWRKHAYRYGRRLRPVHTFAALQFGRAWDAAQDAYHAPQPPYKRSELVPVPAPTRADRVAQALAAGQAAIDEEARRVDGLLVDRGLPRPTGWHEEIDGMRTLLDGMVRHYDETWGPTIDEWRTLATQHAVTVPLPSASGTGVSNRYEFHGIVDRIVEHVPTGDVFVVEVKSAASLSADYRAGYDTDWQLPLYVWALRKDGWRITGAMIDAAAKMLPAVPQLRKTPVPVLDDAGEPVLDPVLDDAGQPVRFASGARKGEVKTVKRTRPALHAMLSSSGTLNYTTTHRVMLDAIREHGLDPADYAEELAILEAQRDGIADNPFFWREELVFNDLQLAEAVDAVRAVAPFAAGHPDVKMPSAMKCKRCEFRSLCAARPDDREALIAANFTTPTEREAATEPEPEPEPVAPF